METFVLAILKYLKDQEVEIYCGDEAETHLLADTNHIKKHIIRGIITAASGDCLVVKVVKGGSSANVYVNGFSIKTIVPVKDSLFIMDIYENELQGRRK
jgi:archaellum biogenesis protein FlaJ (TadC family)